MNIWECNHPSCLRTCVGVGSAYGLRAIGWYFRVGPVIFCPAHRPDGIDGDGTYFDCKLPNCSQCAASVEADKWQKLIREDQP